MSEVDSILFDRNYYLVPEIGGEKAYELLRQALLTSKKVGIAKTVLGNKEELLILYPTKTNIIAKMLFFNEEIVPSPTISKVTVDKNELNMAKMLIDSMTDKFEIEKYHDEYQEKLKEAIQEKIQGQEVVAVTSDDTPTTVIDLMTALQQSIDMTKQNPVNPS